MSSENSNGCASVLGLAEWLRRRVLRAPQRPALTCDDVTWTYGELWQRVERLSGVLAAHGVGRGDRVGYLDFDSPMFFVCQFAAARIGAIFVPLNFRLSAPELAFIINDAGLQVLLAGPNHQGNIDRVRAGLACRHYLGVQDYDASGWPAAVPLMAQLAMVPPQAAVAPDEVAALMYTSGTTGHPKGAMLTHQNFWSQSLNVLLSKELVSSDVALGFVPLFHVGGMLAVTLPTLLVGGHVVLQRSFDAGAVLQAIGRYRATLAFAVPAMLLFMSQHADFAHADLASLRLLSVGGAPMPEPLLRLYAQRGIPVQQGYGLTETSATVTFLPAERAADKLGSCGAPGLMSETCLKDFSGQEIVAAGVKGEVCVRGSNVMKGYWRNAEASAASFDPAGWFHTGDVGYFDEEGFLYLCDRIKDVVISGGENVYPAEVESVLYAHPAIAECAVVGAPDEKWGERVVAVVVLKAGAALTLEGLRSFAENRLAHYKLPSELCQLATLPRNGAGKLLKSQIRAQLRKTAGFDTLQ